MTTDTEALRQAFEDYINPEGDVALHWQPAGYYAGSGMQESWLDFQAGYQAGHAAAKAETAAPVVGRWYFVTNDGAATLCVDEADARESASEADIAFPRMAPHRAVQLVPASELAAAVAKEREPQMPEGWAFYSADFSLNAADAFKPGSVLLTRTGRNRAAWLAMSEEDQEVSALYASGRGFTLDEALRAAIHCVDAIRAGAKEPSDADKT